VISTRTRQTFTISLPGDLAEEIDRVARAESRSRSELMREAFRQYVQRRRRWEAIFAYGEAKGGELGLQSEEDVARHVEEYRQERPGKRSAAG
jgi:metal-responsive CopG/Arc/MetJ family transcriptional regulator